MEVSFHAAERFLQRVLNKKNYNFKDIVDTKKNLEVLFKDVVVNRSRVVIPKFQKFVGILKGKKVVTIIKK